MNNPNIKKVNLTISFFAITIAWILTNVLFSIYMVMKEGAANELGVTLSWSGIYIYLSWIIFLIYPLKRLDHSKRIFNPFIFPLVTGMYAAAVYMLVIGSTLKIWYFLTFAIVVGIIFGLTYILLIRSNKLINKLIYSPALKILFILSPAFFISFFLWLLPIIVPSVVYRFMPDEIQRKIFLKAISKLKVGDSYLKLEKAIPGYFDNNLVGEERNPVSFSSSGGGPLGDYKIEVKNDTITKVWVKRK